MKSKNICKFTESGGEEHLKVGGFILETEREVMVEPYVLSCHRAVLFLSGSGSVRTDGKALPFHTGTLCFFFMGERLSVHPDENCEYMYILFEGRRAEELFRRFGVYENNRCFEGHDGLIPLWRESLLRASAETVDLAAESMLLYTFSRLSGKNAEKNDLLRRITDLSEEHFNDCTLTLAVIAEELNYNPKYLSHLFKEKMGTSYTEYLRMLRLKYAVSLFEHGIDSIKNVALLSGFSDPLYFSSVFKHTLGVSPKEYIERLKN